MRVGPHGAHSRNSGLLIGRVGISVDEEHADGFAPSIEQSLRLHFHLIDVDGCVNVAIGQHTLVHFQAQCTRHDRRETAAQPPSLWPITTAHLQYIAKAARGDDAGARYFAFKQGIGAHRGAMHNAGHT